MEYRFYKYQGAGNDFILLDNRDGRLRPDTARIAALCHRRFGIGADGLMLLEQAEDADFRMIYYNADGRESTMCGNGGRCIAAFAKHLGLAGEQTVFRATDGLHRAVLFPDGNVSLQMQDVEEVRYEQDLTILHTGSPHAIRWVKDVDAADIFHEGRAIRNRPGFQPGGINVNFVQQIEGGLRVRTYERGVEDETLSCGTGVTAAAIAASCSGTGRFETMIQTPGGILKVSFVKDTPQTAKEVVLTGPAALVFEGVISL